MHRPLKLKALPLYFPHKTCFSEFNATINYGDRIALIGDNGTGKTSLLRMLAGDLALTRGEIEKPREFRCGMLPQVTPDFPQHSGGERLNKALSAALASRPNCLLLDEPTNHLDSSHKQNLLRWLRNYTHTLIVVTHDLELLNSCIDIIWHIDDSKIIVYKGSYDDYQREYLNNRNALLKKIEVLNRQKRANHDALMKEQHRAKISRAIGEKHIKQRKYPTIVSAAKACRAEESSGRLKSALNEKRHKLSDELSELKMPEVIKAKFFITSALAEERTILSISQASIAYELVIAANINLSLQGSGRLAIVGPNASGKTTLIKAILGHNEVHRYGLWHTPRREEVGYLDQHYANLDPQSSALKLIQQQRPDWTVKEIRRHLNNFLFRKNEEVSNEVANLSGGEKARLSLAIIASYTPKLLILDEITNNLDLKARAHVIEVLKDYPGAMIVISHDKKFLEAIGISTYFTLPRYSSFQT